ncbi:MAG: serine/threonine-protein kinase [Pirellulaceae bacterium]
MADDSEALLNLLYSEIDLRSSYGESPSVDEYAGRFPALAEQLSKLIEIHNAVFVNEETGAPLDTSGVNASEDMASQAESEQPTDLKANESVGPFPGYALLEKLGGGGMGDVYRARQLKADRDVALKIIRPRAFVDPKAASRFQREIRLAASLDHQGIVPLFEVAEHGGQSYFSMAYVDGPSLAARLRDGPMPAREACEILKLVAESIAYAHKRGVIHRDLKPSNILLGADGPRVSDFGLAKSLQEDDSLTKDGQIVGTPAYMSPEQASGNHETVSVSSDVYSLGATLYHALVGRPPFQGGDLAQVIRQVLETEPVSVRRLDGSIHQDLDTICQKCLEKAASARYASAAALAEELQRYLDGEPISARPLSQLGRFWRRCRNRPLMAGLAALVVFLLLVVLIASPVVAVYRAHLLAQSEANSLLAQRNAERGLAAVNNYVATVQQDQVLRNTQFRDLRQRLLRETRDYYEQFIQANRGNPKLQFQIADAYLGLGTLQVSVGTAPEAIEALERARDISSELTAASPHEPKYREQLGKIFNTLALQRTAIHKLDAAHVDHKAAIKVRRGLVAEFPGEPRYCSQVLSSLNNVALLNNGQNGPAKAAEALAWIDEASRLAKSSVQKFPRDEQVLAAEAFTLRNEALIKKLSGKGLDVLAPARRSVERYELLVARFPGNDKYEQMLLGAANNLAQFLLEEGAIAEARVSMQQVLSRSQALQQRFPTHVAYRLALSKAYANLADVEHRLGEDDAAVKNQLLAIDLLLELAASDPSVSEFHLDLGKSRLSLGLAYLGLMQLSDAQRELSNALAICERLVRDFPDTAEHHTLLEEIEREIAALTATKPGQK